MAETHVISALVKKRAELHGDIQHYETIIKKSKENLTSIDKTIHIFDETYNINTIKSKKTYRNRFFNNGEAKVHVLDVLRESNKPLQTNEISKMIANKKSIEFENDLDSKNFHKSVSTALKNVLNNNLVEKVGTKGLIGIWKIKEVN
jgi:hypothetical protein